MESRSKKRGGSDSPYRWQNPDVVRYASQQTASAWTFLAQTEGKSLQAGTRGGPRPGTMTRVKSRRYFRKRAARPNARCYVVAGETRPSGRRLNAQNVNGGLRGLLLQNIQSHCIFCRATLTLSWTREQSSIS